MRVGVHSCGRSVAVLAALVALFALSLAGTAGAALITPHAATPQTVTPHAVAPAPAPEPEPEPTPAPAPEEEEEEAEGEESSEAEPEFTVHRHDVPVRPPGPYAGRNINSPVRTPFSHLPGVWKDYEGHFSPYEQAPWREHACDEECRYEWEVFANLPIVPRRDDPGPNGPDLQELIEAAVERLAKAYVEADVKVIEYNEKNPVPIGTPCRGQGNAIDNVEQVEDLGSGSHACR